MDVADYLRILRARWLVIVAAVVVALGAAWLTTTTVAPVGVEGPKTYRASTVMLKTGETGNFPLSTLARVATIEPVAAQVADEIGFDGEPLELAGKISATADDVSSLLTIRATDTDRRTAEVLANQFAKQLVAYLAKRNADTSATQASTLKTQLDDLNAQIVSLDNQIDAAPKDAADVLTARRNANIATYQTLYTQYQTVLAQGAEPIGLEVLQDASAVEVEPVGFQPPRSRSSRLIIAAILGLMLGAGLALLIERIGARIRTRQIAEESFGLAVVGEIPRIRRKDRQRIVTATDPRSAPARAFRVLAAALVGRAVEPSGNGAFVRRSTRAKAILVVSAGPDEGKSTVVANLAVAFREMGRRVIVVSADFHRPTIHNLFGVRGAPGLSEQLASPNGKPILQGNVFATSIPDVYIVPSGSRPERPGELLASEAMRSALAEARHTAEIVLIDTAPLFSESDAAQVIPEVDAVLLVARAGRTRADTGRRTGELLARLKAPTIGLVLNDSREVAVLGRYYGYREVPQTDTGEQVEVSAAGSESEQA
jgi:capsular exopolysaccharide synthesis family protein